jgi:hypothetical protein
MIDVDDYGAVGGMRIGRGNRSTRRKPAPVPLCPPHDLTWDRTRAAAVGSQRLTTWAMARTSMRSYLVVKNGSSYKNDFAFSNIVSNKMRRWSWIVIWKDVVVACFKELYHHSQEIMSKTTKNRNIIQILHSGIAIQVISVFGVFSVVFQWCSVSLRGGYRPRKPNKPRKYR